MLKKLKKLFRVETVLLLAVFTFLVGCTALKEVIEENDNDLRQLLITVSENYSYNVETNTLAIYKNESIDLSIFTDLISTISTANATDNVTVTSNPNYLDLIDLQWSFDPEGIAEITGNLVLQPLQVGVTTLNVSVTQYVDFATTLGIVVYDIATPQEIKAEAGSEGILVAWNPEILNSMPDHFSLYRGTSEVQAESVLVYSGKDGQYSDTNIQDSTSYWYFIEGHDSRENASESGSAAIIYTDTFGPAASTALTVALDGSAVKLNWDESTSFDFDHVEIYKSTSSTSPGSLLFSGKDKSETVDNAIVFDGTTYYYTLTNVDINGNASDALEQSITPGDSTAPAAASSFVATAGDSQVTLEWVVANDVSKIYIRRDEGTVAPASHTSGTEVYTGAPTAGTLVDTNAQNNTTYTYSIFTEDAAGNLNATEVASDAVTPADSTPPAPASSFDAAEGDAQVTLTWAVDNDVTKIYIRRNEGNVAPASHTSGTEVYTGAPTAGTLVDTNAENGSLYTYSIFTEDAAGNTNTTVVSASATPQSTADVTPPAPATLDAVAGDAQVTLTWAVENDVTKIYIRRNEGGAPSSYDDGDKVYTGAPTAGTLVDTRGVQNNTEYTYSIFTEDAAGNINTTVVSASATPQAPPDTTAPGAVTNVTVASTETTISLDWTNPQPAQDDLNKIVIYRSNAVVAYGSVTADFEGLTTHFTDDAAELTYDTNYTYSIYAVDDSGNASEVVTVEGTLSDTTPPAVVENPNLTRLEDKIVLSWINSPSNDVVKLNIIRVDISSEGNSEIIYEILNPVSGHTITYTDSNINNEHQYRYDIVVIDKGNNETSQTMYANELVIVFDGKYNPIANAIRALLGLQDEDPIFASALAAANITSLTVNGGVTSMKGIEYLTDLQTLDLSGNSIAGDISETIAPLTQLTELNLADNKITAIDTINNLTQLSKLNLNNNNLAALPPISTLTTLTEIRFAQNSITDISSIVGLTNLVIVNFSSNTGLGNDVLGVFETNYTQFQNMTHLYLANTGITSTAQFFTFKEGGDLFTLSELLTGANLVQQHVLKKLNLLDNELDQTSRDDIQSCSSVFSPDKGYVEISYDN